MGHVEFSLQRIRKTQGLLRSVEENLGFRVRPSHGTFDVAECVTLCRARLSSTLLGRQWIMDPLQQGSMRPNVTDARVVLSRATVGVCLDLRRQHDSAV